MEAGITYGYARVSARDQNLARQFEALKRFPVEERFIYSDSASGKDFDRPSYQKLMHIMRPGDVMVVKSIDRLGRNYDEIIEQWRTITKAMGCAIVVIDMPLLDTRNQAKGLTSAFIADLVLQVLSYVAQIERENIRQRQAEGIALAKARGVRFGRPAKKRPENYREVSHQVLQGKLSRKKASLLLGVSITTLEKWMDADTPGWRNLLKDRENSPRHSRKNPTGKDMTP